MAEWLARSLSLSPEFASLSLLVELVVDEFESGAGFVWILPFTPDLNFIPPLSPLSPHPISLIICPAMVRQIWSTGTLVYHRI